MSHVAKLVLSIMLLTVIGFAQERRDKANKVLDPEFQDLLDKLKEIQPPEWTYSQLADKSDLIVIAKVISRTQVEWDKTSAGDLEDKLVNCFSNKMRVLSTLKGRTEGEIDLLTAEWKPTIIRLTNSNIAMLRPTLLLPGVVQLVIDGEITDAKSIPETHKIEPEYLLYLRKTNGNKYVAVTGPRYSGMSVRLLNN